MKAFKVLAIIFMSFTILLCGLTLLRDFSILEQLSSVGMTGEMAELTKAILKEAGLPTAGTMQAAVALVFATVLMTIVATILCIMGKKSAKMLGLVVIVLSIVLIILHPSMEMGMYGGLSPRGAAFFTAIPAMLTGLCAFLYKPKAKVIIVA